MLKYFILSTGNAATASLSGEKLFLEWSHVFDVTRNVTFSVFAGVKKGHSDVIVNAVTTSTHISTRCTKSLTIYVIVQAVYDNGLSATYTDVIDL